MPPGKEILPARTTWGRMWDWVYLGMLRFFLKRSSRDKALRGAGGYLLVLRLLPFMMPISLMDRFEHGAEGTRFVALLILSVLFLLFDERRYGGVRVGALERVVGRNRRPLRIAFAIYLVATVGVSAAVMSYTWSHPQPEAKPRPRYTRPFVSRPAPNGLN